LLEKRENRQFDQEKEAKSCTFKPKITRLGSQQRHKGVEELSYGDLVKK